MSDREKADECRAALKSQKIDESRTYMYVYVSGLGGFGCSRKKVGTLRNWLQDKQTSAPAVKH